MMGLKIIKKNRLNVQNDARIALGVAETRITAQASHKQENPSHKKQCFFLQ